MHFEWWPGAYALLADADVEPWEAIEVLYSARRRPRPARTAEGLPVLTVWGRTDSDRPLVVVLRQLAEGQWQIIRAVEMTPAYIRVFEEWEAQQ
ncbi:hypothetical protein [Nocardia jiangsuensis]|uniref:DUF4258 domain-containing protein n=1 Tax=Nocardia jiangsuensis TaxID=1691563 RepID=A0ABV8DNG1_9NOCA